jgi:tetratricopeptide (TPR) repeat protein
MLCSSTAVAKSNTVQTLSAEASIEKATTSNLSWVDQYKAQALELQKDSKIDSAVYVIQKVLKRINKTSSSKSSDKERADLLYILGNLYRQKGSYTNAVDSYERGLSLAVKHSMYLTEARILNSLGGVYVETENFSRGLKYIQNALSIYEQKFPDRKADICLLLANIGNIQIELKAYDIALVNLNKALTLNEKIGNDYYYSLIYSGIGLCHLKTGDFNAAILNLDLGMKSSQASGNIPSEIANMANLGTVFIEQEDYATADSILQEAHARARVAKDNYLVKEVLSILVLLHETQGDFEKSYHYQGQLLGIKDSLFTQDLNNKLAVLDLNYENIKKEKEILALKVENQRQSYQLNQNRLLSVIGLIVVILVGLAFIVVAQRNKLKNTRRIAELQNQMFRSQMRPHFIFNVLSTIQTYMSQNDGKKAAVYLSKFARLMRNVLEQSQNEFNSISHEINILKYYLELQQLRFEDGFDFHFEVDEAIDPDIYLIPPLILQPILENAIEHGFPDTTEKGMLLVSFQLSGKDLFIKIKDNGVGIDSIEKRNQVAHSLVKTESLSMKIIGDQLTFYSKRLKNDYFIRHKDLASEGLSGTEVVLKLPYQILKAG